MDNLWFYVWVIVSMISFQRCEYYSPNQVDKYLYVNQDEVTLFVKEELQLTASPLKEKDNFKWTSSEPDIIEVDNNGLIKAISEGNALIKVEMGDYSTEVHVTAINRIPLEKVMLTPDSIILTSDDLQQITVTNIPENANDYSSFKWYSDDPSIVNVNSGGEVSVVGEGMVNILYSNGELTSIAIVDAAFTRPFNGPHILSKDSNYVIPAADFDFGGEGFAFHDSDAENRVGDDNYRRDHGDTKSTPVEIEGYGNNIGYTAAGEWLLYTVNVVDPGDYAIDVSISANGTSGKFFIEVDEENVSGSVSIPDNGSWNDWRWFPDDNSISVHLSEGKHKVKYFIEGASHNFRAIRFTNLK